MTQLARLFRTAALLAIMAGMMGCSVLVRERTLPPSINSVYVPMILNRTQEPGIEERLTVAFQQELMADGRLHVASKKHADAVVEITITSFDEYPFATDSDDFGTVKSWSVKALMNIYENIPGKPPIGKPRTVEVMYGYNDDPRTTTYDPEPRHVDGFAEVFAKVALIELITGEPEDDLEDQTVLNPVPDSGGSGLSIGN